MGYYGGMGDYYPVRGAGDPFLPALGAALAGGIVKKVGGLVGRVIGGRGAGTAAVVSAAGGLALGPGVPLPGGRRLNVRNALPGGRPLISQSQCPPGYHLDKTYGEKCVRNRRLNPTNPAALRRALRRVQGFGALASRAAGDVARANRSLNRLPRRSKSKRKR